MATCHAQSELRGGTLKQLYQSQMSTKGLDLINTDKGTHNNDHKQDCPVAINSDNRSI